MRVILIALCVLYSTVAFSKTFTKDQLIKMGEENYGGHCLLCHKDDGKGAPPAFPGLVGSAVATGPVQKHIEMVLHGIPGTAMVAFAKILKDEEIASIVTYERNKWGNDDQKKYGKNAGGIVQPSDVAKLRKKS